MNQPVGPYDFWRDTLQPGLLGLRAALQQGLLNPLQMAAAPAARYGLLAEGDTKTRQQTLDSLAMSPGLFGDAIGPIADAYRFGTDPESRTWENAGFAALGALPFVPAVGSMVRNADALPMDEASRMARAREMGFDVDDLLYHGTDKKFTSFDPGMNRASSTVGHYFTPDEFTASGYGDNVGKYFVRKGKHFDLTDDYTDTFPIWKEFYDDADVDDMFSPLRSGLEEDEAIAEARRFSVDPAKFDDAINQVRQTDVYKEDGWEWLDSSEIPDDAVETLSQAWEARTHAQWAEKIASPAGYNEEFGPGFRDNFFRWLEQSGYDSVSLFDDAPGGFGASRSTVVFDPKNIRSVDAAFDPAKKDSADLLAQWAALGLLGGGLGAGLLYNDEKTY